MYTTTGIMKINFSKPQVLKSNRVIHRQMSLDTVLLFKLPLYESCETKFAKVRWFSKVPSRRKMCFPRSWDGLGISRKSWFFIENFIIFHIPWPEWLTSSFSPNPPQRLKISQNEALIQYASAKNRDIGCTQALVSWKSCFLSPRSPKVDASFTARCPSAPYYSSSYRSTSHVKRSSRRSGDFQRSQVG